MPSIYSIYDHEPFITRLSPIGHASAVRAEENAAGPNPVVEFLLSSIHDTTGLNEAIEEALRRFGLI